LISSKKFLLVLDGVWNDDDSSGWDKFLAPLKYGRKGSKILLTTRMDRVAEMAAQAIGKTKEVMKLEQSEDEYFCLLFKQYAFAGVNFGEYKKLQAIGTQLARKLKVSPLAAKTIGAPLNSCLGDRHWWNILHTDISDHRQQREGNIMSILMLSYHHLPAHLRPCFSYCSIFPQDYEFVKKDLVLMRMSVGFIQDSPKNHRETLVDIGGHYFDDPVKRSFSDPRVVGFSNEECNDVMHDLLHELAQLVSYGECFRFVGDNSISDIPYRVRHLYSKPSNRGGPSNKGGQLEELENSCANLQ